VDALEVYFIGGVPQKVGWNFVPTKEIVVFAHANLCILHETRHGQAAQPTRLNYSPAKKHGLKDTFLSMAAALTLNDKDH